MINQDNHHKTHKGSFIQCLKGSWSDRFILFAMVCAIIFLWSEINKNLSSGVPTAYIYHQKQLLAVYPLPLDDQIIHVSAKGEIGISEIEVSKQGIRFLSSPCTTRYCTLSGHKSHAGSVIACVPNHVMVVLRGSVSKDDKNIHFDAVTE